jgi:acyl carrier protein
MRERIKGAFKNVFEFDDIADDISQETCADWDSMHHLQLIFELEAEFNVTFEPDDIVEMKSLIEIEKKLNNIIG